MADYTREALPNLIDWFAQDARIAVQVFLVIGGFLAAKSLSPQALSGPAHPWKTILRRYTKLAPPFFVAILLAVAASWLAGLWMTHDAISAPPSGGQLLAHALLLHDVLAYDALGRRLVRRHRFAAVCHVQHPAVGLQPRIGTTHAGICNPGHDGPCHRRLAAVLQPRCRLGRLGALLSRQLWPGRAGLVGERSRPSTALGRHSVATDDRAGTARADGRLSQPHSTCAARRVCAGRVRPHAGRVDCTRAMARRQRRREHLVLRVPGALSCVLSDQCGIYPLRAAGRARADCRRHPRLDCQHDRRRTVPSRRRIAARTCAHTGAKAPRRPCLMPGFADGVPATRLAD